MSTITQVDLFNVNGQSLPLAIKRPKKRDYEKEAKDLLQKMGIAALSAELKKYIAAELILQDFPELSEVMLLALSSKYDNQPHV